MRATGDGPRSSEPQSRDEDDTCDPQPHTTISCQMEGLDFRRIQHVPAPCLSESSVAPELEPATDHLIGESAHAPQGHLYRYEHSRSWL
ncbi:hypothetical protein TNCV_4644011 [Trichonephila clavipes]|nr:hypothetical protein TNCV_4644011 [Trichonephila clavipes]